MVDLVFEIQVRGGNRDPEIGDPCAVSAGDRAHRMLSRRLLHVSKVECRSTPPRHEMVGIFPPPSCLARATAIEVSAHSSGGPFLTRGMWISRRPNSRA